MRTSCGFDTKRKVYYTGVGIPKGNSPHLCAADESTPSYAGCLMAATRPTLMTVRFRQSELAR